METMVKNARMASGEPRGSHVPDAQGRRAALARRAEARGWQDGELASKAHVGRPKAQERADGKLARRATQKHKKVKRIERDSKLDRRPDTYFFNHMDGIQV